MKKSKSVDVKTQTTTTEVELIRLRKVKEAADKEFYKYRKFYNKEHGIGRTLIQEIIDLHKQGLSNKDIIEKGYNKSTVQRQVRLFVKGKKREKTVISKFL